MAFYAGRLVLEPAMENPTLVVLTDRNDLDDQLFGTFSRCYELLRQKPIQAASRENLRELLQVASGGVIFTTIQKFMPPEPSPLPSPKGRGSHYRGGFDYSGLLETARKLRKKQTSAEALLWALLRNRQLNGFKFRREHQFGEYICDLYCDEAKLVVECDGEPHDTEERQKHDHKRDAYLRSLGLTVLRFPNHMVLRHTQEVLESIGAALPSPSGRRAGDEGGALSPRRNIVVIADEAHRSQYDFIDGFARHMRDALPRASFIGFTGTPIEKTDANTRAVFGDYISVYDIQRAVEDGATVPIYYESRLAKLELKAEEKPKIDPDFEEATEGEELEHKERLKTKWAALEAVVGAEKRIGLIAEDLVKHWEERQEAMETQVPYGGKAMIVCMSRRICVELYNAIVKLRPQWNHAPDDRGAIKIVMTGSASDPLEWQEHIRNKPRREALAKRFKDPKDPLKIVLVRDMWLTGFDAPCLHTMYADKPMRSHGLMQAIARVNRVFKNKPGGLVVDYLGLAHELKQALAVYTESGGHGQTAIDQEQAVTVMVEKYEVCCDFFHGFNWSKWARGTPAQKLGLLPAGQEHILAAAAREPKPEEHKQKFLQAVSDLSKAFALAVPHEKAIEIRDDVGFFQAVRAAIAKAGGEKRKLAEELDAAIRQIISRAVVSEEVVDIFAAAGLKKPDISILSDQFLGQVRAMQYKNLAVELLRKLLNNEIRVRSKKFLIQSKSFAAMLEESIRKYQNRAIEAATVIEELIALARQMREAGKRGDDLKLTEDELAFYDALEVNDSAVKVLGEPTLCSIAHELVETIRNSVTIDWTEREAVRAKIRVAVKRILRRHGYPPDKQEKATQTVLQQAELLCADWAG
jgi:type I restriction enzyme R subunit